MRTDLRMLFRDEDSNSVHSMDDDAESVDSGSTSNSPASGKGRVVTGRGITLSTLMNDGIVEAGDGCLSIDYLVSKRII